MPDIATDSDIVCAYEVFTRPTQQSQDGTEEFVVLKPPFRSSSIRFLVSLTSDTIWC